jgi:protein SCO1
MTSGGDRLTRRRLLTAAGALALAASAGACEQAADNEFSDLGRGIDNVVLTSSVGDEVRWGTLRGAPRAVFFGFTHCPVICPVTVYELTAAADRLGSVADDLRIQFVTVDPERDTPERMRTYFSGFGPKVTGYTGSADMLERVTRAFEVTATRVATDNGSYTIDHTATVFLIDRAGRVADVLAYGAEQDVIDTRVGALVSR